MFDDDAHEQGPRGTFEIYKAEGDILFKNGEYHKAIESYTTALEKEPINKSCLVARSRCYLQLGDTDKALGDAEFSLKDDKDFHKGLYQKAEALYYKGEFELALVFYHRGRRLRPELEIFRLGIQKAQEAISNLVGSPDRTKLTTQGDLSFFRQFTEKKAPARSGKIGRKLMSVVKNKGYKVDRKKTESKGVKILLGELYGDRVYLEKLLGSTESSGNSSGRFIYDTVCDGLCYLDARTDLWRQQKPIAPARNSSTGTSLPHISSDMVAKYIKKEMVLVDKLNEEGRLQECITKAKNLMKTVKAYSNDLVPDLQEIVSNLHCCIGNAYMEKKNYEKALKHHKCDLKISKSKKNHAHMMRAYENIAKDYLKMKQYARAIESWTKKANECEDDKEKAYLYHEMGRGYIELGDFQAALAIGQAGLEAADKAESQMWQLNNNVLIAQAAGKQRQYSMALSNYQAASQYAAELGERKAEQAISRAMRDIEDKMKQ